MRKYLIIVILAILPIICLCIRMLVYNLAIFTNKNRRHRTCELEKSSVTRFRNNNLQLTRENFWWNFIGDLWIFWYIFEYFWNVEHWMIHGFDKSIHYEFVLAHKFQTELHKMFFLFCWTLLVIGFILWFFWCKTVELGSRTLSKKYQWELGLIDLGYPTDNLISTNLST